MASKGVKIFGVVLGVLLILFGIMVFALIRFARPAEVKVRNDSVLEVTIAGEVSDLPPTSPLAQFTGQGKFSLLEMGQALRAAAEDERIASIYCRIYPVQSSWASVEEIRSFMHRFRESGKKIYAYLSLDLVGDKDLYLASAADEIHLNQDSALMVNGLVAEVSFYSKMMNKLKVRPDVLQFKEYKSPESFTRSGMTPEFRSMYRSLLSDIQQRLKQALSRERGIEPQQLDRLMQYGILSASSALDAGLVTHLGYEDEIRNRLKTESSGGEPEYRSISASDYLKAVKRRKKASRPNKVALLGGIGPIMTGRSDETWENTMGGDTIVSRLRKIRKDKSVKGLLFRVNSPGGSAVGFRQDLARDPTHGRSRETGGGQHGRSGRVRWVLHRHGGPKDRGSAFDRHGLHRRDLHEIQPERPVRSVAGNHRRPGEAGRKRRHPFPHNLSQRQAERRGREMDEPHLRHLCREGG